MTMVTVTAIGLGSIFNVHASEIPTAPPDVAEDTSKYDALNEYLIQHAREILSNPKARASITLSGIKRLTQADSRWGSVVINGSGEKATISSAGCCLTSFAMVRNLISGTSDTPADINTTLGDYAYNFRWDIAEEKYDYTVLTSKRKDSGISKENVYLNIVGVIDEYSLPAIVGFKLASDTTKTHFVVAHGYTLDGDLIICDPAGRNYTKISQYYDAGYYVYEFYVYDKN